MNHRKKTSVNLKKKIRKLLNDGLKPYRIAKQLNLSRGKVGRIVDQIEASKRNWNKKDKVLNEHIELIQQLINEKKSPGSIYRALQRKNVNVDYSTFYRFATNIIQSIKGRNLKSSTPHAIVSFNYAGKLNKIHKKYEVWVFCLQLMESSYRFYEEVNGANVAIFINCHVKAFAFLKGAPPIIHLNYIEPAIIQSEGFLKTYSQFLNYFGIQYSKEYLSIPRDESCNQIFKESFFKSILHNQHSRFTKELKRWFSRLNLEPHPILKKIIKKVFEEKEKPFLLPLPLKPYPSTGTCVRKVNERGFVFFDYNWYEVPKEYSSRCVTVMFYDKQVKIFFDNNLIAVHKRSHSQKTRIKLV
jgi:hypothetical protein